MSSFSFMTSFLQSEQLEFVLLEQFFDLLMQSYKKYSSELLILSEPSSGTTIVSFSPGFELTQSGPHSSRHLVQGSSAAKDANK